MKRDLVVLRPQPGNDETAARARALGIGLVQIPLFEVVGVRAAPPQGPFDAVLLTSANGARFGGEILAAHASLPVFAVGEATAEAARAHGSKDVRTGGGDVATTIPMIAHAGLARVLHLCGEETRPFDPRGLTVVPHVVYRSDARDMRPFVRTLATLPPAVIAVHSPAAGRRLNALMPPACRNHILLAISPAAAQAAGNGWRQVQVAPSPDDTALLRIASTLCMDAS